MSHVNAENRGKKIEKIEKCLLSRGGSRIGKLAFLHRKSSVFC